MKKYFRTAWRKCAELMLSKKVNVFTVERKGLKAFSESLHTTNKPLPHRKWLQTFYLFIHLFMNSFISKIEKIPRDINLFFFKFISFIYLFIYSYSLLTDFYILCYLFQIYFISFYICNLFINFKSTSWLLKTVTDVQRNGLTAFCDTLSPSQTYVATALQPLRDWQFPPIAKVVTRSPIGPGEVAEKSATDRGPRCDQISRSQVFVLAQKPGCD